jgi:hypothetical protein
MTILIALEWFNFLYLAEELPKSYRSRMNNRKQFLCNPKQRAVGRGPGTE